MASWGTRRRNIIIFLFFLVCVVALGLFGILFFYEKPNCFDGVKNGEEQGIDCGGNCTLICTNQVLEPIVHWKRYFEIVPGIYNVIAYVENRNPGAGASNISYSFRLYDNNNVILADRRGVTDLHPNQIIPIIENNISTGDLRVARVSFEFTNEIEWFKQNPLENLVFISDQTLTKVDNLPRITANVFNNTLNVLFDLRFVVIVYDGEGNAIATSNTIVSKLDRNEKQNIIFTWPKNFLEKTTRFEIIPLYDNGL